MSTVVVCDSCGCEVGAQGITINGRDFCSECVRDITSAGRRQVERVDTRGRT